MKITIHAEVEGGEKQNVYEGTSPAEAKTFLQGLKSITVLQANMSNEVNGQAHTLVRSAKGDAVAPSVADAVSWLEENGAPSDNLEREKVTIGPGDIETVTVAELLGSK